MNRDVLSRQVIVSGRLTDLITGARPRALAEISVVDDATGRPVPGITVRVAPDGFYSAQGDPSVVLPPAALALRLEISAEGYASSQVVAAFTLVELTRADTVLTIRGEAETVSLIQNLPRVRDLALAPDPVRIGGLVVDADAPNTPLTGATVQITAPAAVGPVLTNADGFFLLPPAPVVETVTLSISQPGRLTITPDFRLDYRSPINRGAFALEPS